MNLNDFDTYLCVRDVQGDYYKVKVKGLDEGKLERALKYKEEQIPFELEVQVPSEPEVDVDMYCVRDAVASFIFNQWIVPELQRREDEVLREVQKGLMCPTELQTKNSKMMRDFLKGKNNKSND